MDALRDLIRRYPVAAVAVVVAAAALGGWSIYQSRLAQQPESPVSQAPAPQAAAPPTMPSPSIPAVTPTTPAGAGGTTPSGQTGPGQGAASSAQPGGAQSNPFQPLSTPSGSTPQPRGAAMPLVPPVPPSAAGGQSGPAQAPAPTNPMFRLAGLVWRDDAALAILEDGQGSYVVGRGETVRPGTAVVAIDVQEEVLRLNRGGTLLELRLAGARRSP